MTEMPEFDKVLAVIQAGIDAAKRKPKAGEPVPADDYVAWCVVNELRRAGFKIVRNSNQGTAQGLEIPETQELS